jgi:hypothetical protein
MHELIIENRGDKAANAPNTWKPGCTPIDGVFTSVALTFVASGYLNVEEIPSDHQSLWIDFDADVLFGHRTPPIIQRTVRKLQVGNTKSCAKWRKLFNNTYTRIMPSSTFTICKPYVQPL